MNIHNINLIHTLMNTNWSTPKTNIFLGMLDLRKALANGFKAKLIRMRNEDCLHPIEKKIQNTDFRNYEFQIGYGSSINEINKNTTLSEYEKYLSLNYVSCFGTPEAIKKYYEEFILSKDNFCTMGRSYLVHADDLIKYLERIQDFSRADMYRRQYRPVNGYEDVVHLFDFFSYKHGSQYALKEFRRKLWVVALLDKDEFEVVKIPIAVKILNVLLYPLKYIPKKTILRMPKYTLYDFRIGDICNGFKIEFQIPKKFSFKN